jgi:biotin synthase
MRAHVGTIVYVCGLIEFSNYCRNNCLYCGLRRDNTRLQRYRMPPAEILRAAKHIADDHIKIIVLQSGDDPAYSSKDICGIIKSIKKLNKDLAVTLAVGFTTRCTRAVTLLCRTTPRPGLVTIMPFATTNKKSL